MTCVSVIIPAYNPGPYLSIAVQSVVQQTYDDLEILVVDDGSSESLAYIARLHPSVRVICQKNHGASIARNVGILASTGDFIAFLDADDIWQPEKLGIQVDLLKRNANVGLCHTSFQMINDAGVVIGQGFEGCNKDYQELLTSCGICASTVVIRRECLAFSGLFDPLSVPVEDYDMWLKIARHYEIVRVDSNQAFYRMHSQNISGNYRRMFQMQYETLHRHFVLAVSHKDHKSMKSASRGKKRSRELYGVQAFDHARRSLRQRELKAFFSHFIFAFSHSPKYVMRSVLSYFLGGAH